MPSAVRRPWRVRAPVLFLAVGALLSPSACSNPLDLCTPKQSRLGFFSKGDCMLTRASFFQGHEWLTWFANRDLPLDDRFSDAEIQSIAEGNRRVDWPKELLVHMNASVLAYVSALEDHTNRPEHQRLHFLLSRDNDSEQAAQEARDTVAKLTADALVKWTTERERALAMIGQANHVIQDAFSAAHAVRDPDHPARPWCVTKVKAYIERAPGFDTPDIEYHGTDSDGVGHTTTEDSIYREGRDCHEPQGASAVEACLSETAERARLATGAYLAVVRQLIRDESGAGPGVDARVRAALQAFFQEHLSLCP